jgi:AraC-like DNA-binding protein
MQPMRRSRRFAFDVGFQNLANFNRHFLKMKHMTPTEYRQTAQAELAPNLGVVS